MIDEIILGTDHVNTYTHPYRQYQVVVYHHQYQDTFVPLHLHINLEI